MVDEDFEKLYQSILHFLSYRPRSEKEVRDFVLRKKKSRSSRLDSLASAEFDKLINDFIGRLKEENLVNDDQFIEWWIQQRLEFNHKGPRIIKFELLQKGLDKDLIEEKLESISKKELEKSAINFVNKKASGYQKLENRVQKYKLIKQLLQRGFNYQLSKSLVDELVKKR